MTVDTFSFNTDPAAEESFPGLYRGIVLRTNDPEHRNRIVCKVPALNGDAPLAWALPLVASDPPPLGSVVWMSFEHGDIDHPVWLGSLTQAVTSTSTTTTRRTATYKTSGGEQELGAVVLGKSFRVISVSTTTPARVRLYASAADQIADETRFTGEDPPPGRGVLLDVLTVPELLTVPLSPQADGSSLDSPVTSSIPVTVTPTTTASTTVTLTYLRTE